VKEAKVKKKAKAEPKLKRGGVGQEHPCPEPKKNHADCLRCGGFGTIWLHGDDR
jgi:hypothetical protein